MKHWWQHINEVICGWIGVVLLFALQFLWWLTTPLTKVPIWSLYFVVVGSFLVVVVVYAFLRRYYDKKTLSLIVNVKQYFVFGDDIILIIDSSSLLSYGMVIMAYVVDNVTGAEGLFGWGFVQSKTSSGYVQVQIAENYEDVIPKEDFRSRFVNPSNLLVKPYLAKELLGY